MRRLALVPATTRRLCGDCFYGEITEVGVHCRVYCEVVLTESTATDCPCWDARSFRWTISSKDSRRSRSCRSLESVNLSGDPADRRQRTPLETPDTNQRASASSALRHSTTLSHPGAG